MSNQQADTIALINYADFTQPGWMKTIIDGVTDDYARGYLDAMYVLYDFMCRGDELEHLNMQGLMRDICELDIWGKS